MAEKLISAAEWEKSKLDDVYLCKLINKANGLTLYGLINLGDDYSLNSIELPFVFPGHGRQALESATLTKAKQTYLKGSSIANGDKIPNKFQKYVNDVYEFIGLPKSRLGNITITESPIRDGSLTVDIHDGTVHGENLAKGAQIALMSATFSKEYPSWRVEPYFPKRK